MIMQSIKEFLIHTFISHKIQRTPYYLIALLTINMLIVTGVTIGLLYNIGYNQKKEQLVDLVKTQSVMIKIVARQALLSHNIYPSDIDKNNVAEKFIRQITERYPQYGTTDKTGEFTLGKRDNEMIRFIFKQRHISNKKQIAIPWNSTLAEPMRRALKGQTGVDVLLDYRGNKVLAAYEPISYLGWGIVAKIDIDEVRAPYIHAAAYAFAFSLLLAISGSIIFWLYVNPLVNDIEESRQFNNLLISKSPTGLILCSLEGNFIDVNDTFLKIIGRSKDQIFTLNYFDLVASKYLENEKIRLKTLQKTGLFPPSESYYIHSKGGHIPVKVSGERIVMKNTCYLWLSIDDIREFKAREAELMLMAAVFENAQEAIFITDSKKNIIKANQAFTNVTGFSFEEIVGRTPSILKSGRHDHSFYHQMFETIHNTGTWHGEIWNKRKDGVIYPSLQSISAIYDENKKLIRYVSILTDISIQKAYEQQLFDNAHHDPLTQLPNRLYFYQKFDQMLLREQYVKEKFALFFIDLNRFKEINDTMGHNIGDYLLKSVASSLKASVRAEDFVARLGGDEFVVIIQSVSDNEEVIAIAKHMLNVTQNILQIQEYAITPSLSIGIAIHPDHGMEKSVLLKCADEAMYYAKHHTKNHYALCDVSTLEKEKPSDKS
jgi:diguanylate cyclase (GGDEF)-like protein/PAS domain S-box-containing protein